MTNHIRLLTPPRSGPPLASTLDQVIAFNGDDVGQIGNDALRRLIYRFIDLRGQTAITEGLSWMFSTFEGERI